MTLSSPDPVPPAYLVPTPTGQLGPFASLPWCPRYSVNPYGQVWSYDSQRLLAGKVIRGRRLVHVKDRDGRRRWVKVYGLVAQAFVHGRTAVRCSINHIDGDRTSEVWSNLEWVSHKEQHEHARALRLHLRGDSSPVAKLTEETVLEILRLYGAGGIRQEDLGKMFGVSQGQVSSVLCGRSWGHVTGRLLVAKPRADLFPPPESQVLAGDVERWLPWPEAPSYFVSSHGRVWSAVSGAFCQTSLANSNGTYAKVALTRPDGYVVVRQVHRLVAKLFVSGETEVRDTVNHKDRDTLNNVWWNLEWASDEEQQAHKAATGLALRLATTR